MDVVARGQLNFNDLEATPDDIWDYISPRQQTTSVSELWQVQGTLAKDLFELPGGPLQAAVGLSYRDESIDAPSANPGTLGIGRAAGREKWSTDVEESGVAVAIT